MLHCIYAQTTANHATMAFADQTLLDGRHISEQDARFGEDLDMPAICWHKIYRHPTSANVMHIP